MITTQTDISSAPNIDVHSTGSTNMSTSHMNDSTILKHRITDIGPGLSYFSASVWKNWFRIPAQPMANSISQVYTPFGRTHRSRNGNTADPITTTVNEYHITITATGVVLSLRRFISDRAEVMAATRDRIMPTNN